MKNAQQLAYFVYYDYHNIVIRIINKRSILSNGSRNAIKSRHDDTI